MFDFRKLLPKYVFKWTEPTEFMRLRDESNRKKNTLRAQLFRVTVIAVMMMGFWFLCKTNPAPGKHPPDFLVALLLAVIMGLFVTYGIPMLDRFDAHKVSMTNEVFSRSRGNRNVTIRWSELKAYGVSKCHETPVFWLTTERDDTLLIGIEESVDLEELRKFLENLKDSKYVEAAFNGV